MEIMHELLQNHNIEFLDEPEKHVDSLEHYDTAHFQGDINDALRVRVK